MKVTRWIIGGLLIGLSLYAAVSLIINPGNALLFRCMANFKSVAEMLEASDTPIPDVVLTYNKKKVPLLM